MYVLPLATCRVVRGGEYGASRGSGFHHGTDFVAAVGTVAFAVIGGVVVRSGTNPVYGNFVTWRGDDGLFWSFAHLKDVVTIPNGTRIETGTPLVLTGATGNVTGAHLHVGVGRSSVIGVSSLDPMHYLLSALAIGSTSTSGTNISPIAPENEETQMRTIRHPNGTITAIGELTYQHLTATTFKGEDQAYEQMTAEGYDNAIVNTQIRLAYFKAAMVGASSSTVDTAAITAAVIAGLAANFAALPKAVNDDAAERLRS